MTLAETIRTDLAAAMKQKNTERTSVLRMLIAGIKNAAIEKRRELSDEEVVAQIRTEAKRLREAAEEFHRGGREDLVAQNKSELAMLEAYLPAMMDEDAVRKLVRAALAGRDRDPKQVGKITGEIMGAHKGKIDGGMLSKILKEEMGK